MQIYTHIYIHSHKHKDNVVSINTKCGFACRHNMALAKWPGSVRTIAQPAKLRLERKSEGAQMDGRCTDEGVISIAATFTSYLHLNVVC